MALTFKNKSISTIAVTAKKEIAVDSIKSDTRFNKPKPKKPKKEIKREDFKTDFQYLLYLFRGKYPKCFVKKNQSTKLLKVGIHLDLIKNHPEISKNRINKFLRQYTGKYYKEKICLGAKRYDLFGNKVKQITNKDINNIRNILNY